jgi:hypothetical protein
MKIGSADASKNSKNTNRLVHAKLPTRQISEIRIRDANNILFTSEYQAVSNVIIRTAVLNSTKGKLKPW